MLKPNYKKNKPFGLKVELDDRLPFDKAIRLFKRKVAKGRAVKRWQKKQEKTHLEGKSKKY